MNVLLEEITNIVVATEQYEEGTSSTGDEEETFLGEGVRVEQSPTLRFITYFVLGLLV